MKNILSAFMTILMGTAGCVQGAKYTTQNNAEFIKTIADPTVQLVDVRTADEYATGYILGAVNIDISRADFDRQAAALDKLRPVAVYCRSGMRSRKAAARLADLGFTVYNLDVGILGWKGKTTKPCHVLKSCYRFRQR